VCVCVCACVRVCVCVSARVFMIKGEWDKRQPKLNEAKKIN
jgi:hypothetical protein